MDTLPERHAQTLLVEAMFRRLDALRVIALDDLQADAKTRAGTDKAAADAIDAFIERCRRPE